MATYFAKVVVVVKIFDDSTAGPTGLWNRQVYTLVKAPRLSVLHDREAL